MKVNYTCSAKGQGVFETTDSNVINDLDIKKSRVFSPLADPKPVNILAGMDQPGQPPWKLKDMTPEIRNKLALTLVGRNYGSTYETVIESVVPEGMEDNNRYRFVKKTRRVPRVRKIPINDYLAGHGKIPVVGEKLYDKAGSDSLQNPFATVVAVDNNDVSIELIAGNGNRSDLPWGTLKTVDKGDKNTVTVVLESEVGLLVRTGPVVGRVVEINDKTVKIDYGHPFAGEILECHVDILDKETD